jgi:hypothetical protein
MPFMPSRVRVDVHDAGVLIAGIQKASISPEDNELIRVCEDIA